MRLTRSRGFSLIELMIVVVIIAILAAVAVPSYRNHVCKVERNQAKADLMSFAQAVERYYTTNNFSYVDATTGKIPATVGARHSPSDSPATNKRFDLVSVDGPGNTEKNRFLLKATRLAASDCDDGVFRIDSAGFKDRDKNDDGTFTDGWED